MKIQDTQYTADELAIMNGQELPDTAPPVETQAAAEAEEGDEPGEAAAPAASTDTPAEAAAADAGEPADDGAKPFIPQFDATGPENYDEAKKAIRAEKAELRSKWSQGDLTDEAYAAAEAAIEDKMEALQSEHLTAQAMARANANIQAQQAKETLQSIANSAKAHGIDYQDEGLALLFDSKLKAVAADAAFAGKSYAERAHEAHNRVAQLLGKTTAVKPTGTKADGAKPQERTQIPQTLAGMPAAAALPVGQDLSSQLDSIDDPDLLEAKWASLPTSQRTAMLRASLPARR